MKIAYFDCFAGISGDMTLGALIDAGADSDKLRQALSSLNISGYHIEINKIEKGHISATDVEVVLDEHQHHHRHLGDIVQIIENAKLSDWVKKTSEKIFTRLAEAEATVHGSTPEDVHFHEVGAVDAIVDIVGSAVCLDLLGRPKVVSSPMPTFHGFATGAHGTFPLPAPATTELLKGIPWRPLGVEGELVTPTGAAIIAAIASSFGDIPLMAVKSIGYGSGKKEREFPNLLRVMLGQTAEPASLTKVTVIETNIDDLNPQFYDLVIDRLFTAGALDVFLTPLQMKKSRPGVLLSTISSPELADELIRIILSETSTLGVRVQQMDRICLDRRWEEVKTSYGPIRIKIGEMSGNVVNTSPEYEDCKKAAETHNVPVKLVYEEAIAAFGTSCEQLSSEQ